MLLVITLLSCWCFLPKGRFFLIDAKFLCHVPFLSALHNQSHSLHLLTSMHPITLFLHGLPGVFYPWNLPSMTLCNTESCLKTCPIQFFCLFLKFAIKERLSSTIPNICSFDACCVQGIFIIRRHDPYLKSLKTSDILLSQCPGFTTVWNHTPDQDFNNSFLQS